MNRRTCGRHVAARSDAIGPKAKSTHFCCINNDHLFVRTIQTAAKAARRSQRGRHHKRPVLKRLSLAASPIFASTSFSLRSAFRRFGFRRSLRNIRRQAIRDRTTSVRQQARRRTSRSPERIARADPGNRAVPGHWGVLISVTSGPIISAVRTAIYHARRETHCYIG
jgi:hypothetical protein